jgi:mRNA-degrading endonuclease RelE of RelBE toxin-antitoxin system
MTQYDWHRRFMAEYERLSKEDQDAFQAAIKRFVAALREGRAFDPGLGIRQMTGHPGIYEFHFSKRGRATFHYKTEERGKEADVMWRRIGGHEIYKQP